MTVARTAPAAVVLTAVAAFAQAPNPAPAPGLPIDSDAAMVTIAIRPDRAPAFDAVLDTLKRALLRTTNPQRRAQAAGWQTFKAEETVQGNLTYVMRLDPAVRGSDYDWARIIAEEFPSDEAEVARVVRDAVVTRTVLPLTRVAVPGLGETATGDDGRPHTEARVPVLSFDTAQAVVITVLVRAGREPEFLSTLEYLGKALGASTAAARRRQARGWRVFKSSQIFGENNVAFVMSLDPVVNRAEYDVIRLIQESYPGDVDAIFGKYRGAYAGQAVARLTNRIEMSK